MKNYAQEQSITINGLFTRLLWIKMKCYSKWLQKIFNCELLWMCVITFCNITARAWRGSSDARFTYVMWNSIKGRILFWHDDSSANDFLERWSQGTLLSKRRSKARMEKKPVNDEVLSIFEGWIGNSRCKLLHIEWVNNKVLLYSTWSYIQYPEINHNGKDCKVYLRILIIYMCTHTHTYI